MENIFNMTTDQFVEEMKMIMPETKEAHQHERNFAVSQEEEELSLLFLAAVFSYAKKLIDRKARSTLFLINLLQQIVKTRGVMDSNSVYTVYIEGKLLAKMDEDPKQSKNALIFGGLTLQYYYKISEVSYHSKNYSVNIDIEILKLRLTNEDYSAQYNALKDKDTEKPLALSVFEELDKTVVGQTYAKKALSMAVHRFVNFGDRTPLLLEGSTGSGKTFLFQKLSQCKLLRDRLTFFSYPLTEITPNGFTGDDLEKILKYYRRECEIRCKFEEGSTSYKGVIFLDEADKLLYPNHDSNGEDVNQTILHQMLTTIDGTSSVGDVDSENILFILAGAFENLEEIRNKHKREIGFSKDEGEEDAAIRHFSLEYDLRQELLQNGAPPQFVARIGQIVHLDKLGREEIHRILLDEEFGIITEQMKQMKKEGLELIIHDDNVIEKMIDSILASKMGARGTREQVKSWIGVYDFDMLKEGYSTMILHEGVLKGEAPWFEKGGKKIDADNRRTYHRKRSL